MPTPMPPPMADDARAALEPRAAVPPCAAARPKESPADRKVRTLNLCAVIVPFLGLMLAVWFSWGTMLDWVQVWIFTGMAVATAAGITIGYHRLATHRSFEAVAPVRYLFLALGSMAVQGPIFEWAGNHRRHHQHSDEAGDPHSPNVDASGTWRKGLKSTLAGLWHAHIGWLFQGHSKGLGRYIKDLQADPVMVAVNRQFQFWVLAGLLLPALLGGLITWSLTGALLGLLWGGLVRVFLVHHVTWSVNSVCHLWGTSPFRSQDHSRNNAIVGVLAMGEGWHNNHHAFPTSARHGLRWWELDTSYLIIRTLSMLGLVRAIRLPTRAQLAAKKRSRAAVGDVKAPALTEATAP